MTKKQKTIDPAFRSKSGKNKGVSVTNFFSQRFPLYQTFSGASRRKKVDLLCHSLTLFFLNGEKKTVLPYYTNSSKKQKVNIIFQIFKIQFFREFAD